MPPLPDHFVVNINAHHCIAAKPGRFGAHFLHGGLARLAAADAEALREVLPGVPVAAPKALQGETFGAAGAIAIAQALAWMKGAPVAPLVAGEPLKTPPRVVVVTAVGFYGNASAVVLAVPEEAAGRGAQE